MYGCDVVCFHSGSSRENVLAQDIAVAAGWHNYAACGFLWLPCFGTGGFSRRVSPDVASNTVQNDFQRLLDLYFPASGITGNHFRERRLKGVKLIRRIPIMLISVAVQVVKWKGCK